MRLDKYLSDNGQTRSAAKKWIASGAVCVNGAPVTDPGAHISPCDAVTCQGAPLDPPGDLYLMMHKPAGCVTAKADARLPVVFDWVPKALLRKTLCAVGRLDRDVTGLLLLTTNGEAAHRLIAPRYHIEKVYEATVDGALDAGSVERMAEGLTLSDFVARPARLEILSPNEGRLTVTEGKFHQVKRMFAEVGCPVVTLRRVSVAGLRLDPALEPGDVRPLTDAERAQILRAVGLPVL